jgi:hypothetical protein
MMSFATLTGAKSVDGSIKSWMNYSRIDAEGILEEAQAMIYGRLRVREMRASDQFTVRVGASSVDEPDGLLDAILFWDITNDVEICSKEDSDLERMRSWTDGVLDDGDPAYYALYDELINFDCKTTTPVAAPDAVLQAAGLSGGQQPDQFPDQALSPPSPHGLFGHWRPLQRRRGPVHPRAAAALRGDFEHRG